jgi:hypothetical protein
MRLRDKCSNGETKHQTALMRLRDNWSTGLKIALTRLRDKLSTIDDEASNGTDEVA